MTIAEHEALQATAHLRMNIGCGDYPMLYWTNLDIDPKLPADLHVAVPPIPAADGVLEDIYAGHFLEHLSREDASAFMAEAYRSLRPGGRLGILVPDMREVFSRYLRRAVDEVEYPRGTWSKISDLDTVNELFSYSTVQDSPHKWGYDLETLARLFTKHGFTITGEINRFSDPRIPVPAWYQCGLDGVK